MAGHSKWANIKFRKGLQDKKRGKIFTKLIREITVAAQMGGAEEINNPRLRDAVIKALKSNMKRDTIDNAIKRGAGGLEGANMMEMSYEGYAPGGIAVLVECLSDNKNRTVSEVRHAFTKYGGNLGTDGSVAYLFVKQGQIVLNPTDKVDEAMDLAIEEGAEDVVLEDNHVIITTAVDTYHRILQAIEKAGFAVEHAEISRHAENMLSLDADTAERVTKLIDMLEDLDDVQSVYTNAELMGE